MLLLSIYSFSMKSIAVKRDPVVHASDADAGLREITKLSAEMVGATPERQRELADRIAELSTTVKRSMDLALMLTEHDAYFRMDVQQGQDVDWVSIRQRMRVLKREAFSSDEEYDYYMAVSTSGSKEEHRRMLERMPWLTRAYQTVMGD
jgi:hypothetical protein